jgi:hypothetical protein
MDNNEEGFYTIDFSKVVTSKDFLATTRLLAANMMANPYITVGDYLKDITDEDLKTLLERSEFVDEDDIGEDFILISQMLATGEGLDFSSDIDQVATRVSQFIMYLTLESLHRKGMVKIYRENFSFGEDVGHKIIAEKMPDDLDE